MEIARLSAVFLALIFPTDLISFHLRISDCCKANHNNNNNNNKNINHGSLLQIIRTHSTVALGKILLPDLWLVMIVTCTYFGGNDRHSVAAEMIYDYLCC